MITGNAREQGREYFQREAWSDAYALFSTADREEMLEPEDLVQFAEAAYLIGRDAESESILERAYHRFLDRKDVESAARSGFWLGMGLVVKGERARGGGWSDAMDEAVRARELLCRPPGEPAAGAACYQQAELHRLRGEFSKAEEAYVQASRWGRKPQPGLAQLRLAQGKLDDAKAAVQRVETETQDRTARSQLLPVYVEIMVAAGNLEKARMAVDELSDIADRFDAPFLRAVAAHARGALLLAEGNPRDALDQLHPAWTAFENLDARYESARVRLLIGRACRELGDEDTARVEFDAARWVFERLGAAPDVDRVEALLQTDDRISTHSLTPRELQVLRLVATGKTNKSIAAELFISERTVDRHVSNIYAKLDVSSRAAATAYAYEYDLV